MTTQPYALGYEYDYRYRECSSTCSVVKPCWYIPSSSKRDWGESKEAWSGVLGWSLSGIRLLLRDFALLGTPGRMPRAQDTVAGPLLSVEADASGAKWRKILRKWSSENVALQTANSGWTTQVNHSVDLEPTYGTNHRVSCKIFWLERTPDAAVV